MNTSANVVAIDGPAGAGKSTVAKRVAKALAFDFLDTGAMYRAATWWAMSRGIDLDDADALAESTAALPLEMEATESGARVLVDGQDVTQAIRTPEVTRVIYKLDQNPAVRAHLVALQQEFGRNGGVVAEGRDIGTVVFPSAKCKIYLDASLGERARRRAAQMRAQGHEPDEDKLREDIRVRDEQSMNRKVSPLRRAEDAVLVDTTDMDIGHVVAAIVDLARSAGLRNGA